MIAEQLRQILDTGDEAAAELNHLVDQFREDRDPTELLELINSTSDEFIEIGAWILSEIRPERYNTGEFLDRLHELTAHPSPVIRIHSLSALYPFLRGGDTRTINLIARMQNDENEGVKIAAEAAALRLGITN
ncbi:MAG: hypothetical protein KatS3mg111_3392 [Pirellulaceae bacterium]|nr:MAG: hypothetical protein KatS3mg111_3392 [Pirellulaceae bacterium]